MPCRPGTSSRPPGAFAAVAPKVTWADHGGRFVAAVENGPLSATQFHPEKSGDAGLALLRELGGLAVSDCQEAHHQADRCEPHRCAPDDHARPRPRAAGRTHDPQAPHGTPHHRHGIPASAHPAQGRHDRRRGPRHPARDVPARRLVAGADRPRAMSLLLVGGYLFLQGRRHAAPSPLSAGPAAPAADAAATPDTTDTIETPEGHRTP